MSDYNFLLAGFGGQGILFAGKVIAYSGLIDEKQVSWLPSYGPEMRGGTANCSVCLSEQTIGSPLVTEPSGFVAMNLPSYDKFIGAVAPGGVVIVESSLIEKKTDRTDVKAFYVPATQLAEENGLKGLANIILIGKLWKETQFCTRDALYAAVKKSVPAKKAHLLDSNIKALEIGINF
ncbi:MAG: 2-oxoacid:acceptor oxidoreductase family protein [Clostridia bacterium]|nr:2-oxoacid:acceptor oxidoreductase family protein [Clostridia bacterium]MBQ9994570.1 2-oxoacid:acceptor oxidoreductase family protein [Clostridia bacterium]